MFSKIIVATDLSAASELVIGCLDRFYQLGTREVLLLQCIRPFEAASLAYTESADKMQRLLKEQESKVSKQGFVTKCQVVFGSVHKEVNRIAREGNFSVIVIGSHGQTLAKDILLGSAATEIIQSATKPVLIIRVEITTGPDGQNSSCHLSSACQDVYNSVLYPTDFSANADSAFRYVEKLAVSGTKQITLLHIQDAVKLEKASPKEFDYYNGIDMERLEKMKNRLLSLKKDVTVNLVISTGKPSLEILKQADEIEPSLIVMGSQGRGYIKELFMGSVSHSISRHAKTSVLLVPYSDTTEDGK